MGSVRFALRARADMPLLCFYLGNRAQHLALFTALERDLLCWYAI